MTRQSRAELLSWLAADVELMDADAATGRVPDGVTRPLFSHEVAARTDFAQLEADVDGAAGELAKLMEQDRQRFLELLAADLAAVAKNPGVDPVDVAVAARLLQLHAYLGIAAVAGVDALVSEAESRYRDLLARAAQTGAERVAVEARQMGVAGTPAAPPKLSGLDEYRLDLAARRLAQTPHTDVLDAAAAEAYKLPGASPGALMPDVMVGLRALSPQPLLTTLARPAVQQSDGLGRQAAMAVLPAAKGYYASELLDKNTCQPCSAVDGTAYATLAEAKMDYPYGGYRDCLGGDRCRGTIVAVWGSEQPHGAPPGS